MRHHSVLFVLFILFLHMLHWRSQYFHPGIWILIFILPSLTYSQVPSGINCYASILNQYWDISNKAGGKKSLFIVWHIPFYIYIYKYTTGTKLSALVQVHQLVCEHILEVVHVSMGKNSTWRRGLKQKCQSFWLNKACVYMSLLFSLKPAWF